MNAKFKRENVLQISWNFEFDIQQTIKMNKWNAERGRIRYSTSGKFYDVDNFNFRGTSHNKHTLSLFDIRFESMSLRFSLRVIIYGID